MSDYRVGAFKPCPGRLPRHWKLLMTADAARHKSEGYPLDLGTLEFHYCEAGCEIDGVPTPTIAWSADRLPGPMPPGVS